MAQYLNFSHRNADSYGSNLQHFNILLFKPEKFTKIIFLCFNNASYSKWLMWKPTSLLGLLNSKCSYDDRRRSQKM